MRRREFIGLIGGAAATWPLAARPQNAPARLGVLFGGTEGSAFSKFSLAEVNEGLREAGLVEGRDYVLEPRFAAGAYGRSPALARELARDDAKILLLDTSATVRAAQSLSPPIPIVMLGINDPVGTGLIASLARPGGHTTGVGNLTRDLMPKILDYQRMIAPEAKVLGVIFNPANPLHPPILEKFRTRAGAMGMAVQSVAFSLPEELDTAFASVEAAKPDVLHLVADSFTLDVGDRICAFAKEKRIPLFSTYPPLVDFGCLLAYGTPPRKLFVRAGYYVRRILEGADPADLPVEQPTEIELWLNAKTASALGIAVPLTLLATAAKVIE